MTNERNERRCVAFPEWMCRMNPFLRRADEDVLFLYFRERWSNALRRPWRLLIARFTTFRLLNLLLFLGFTLSCLTGMMDGICAFLFLLAGLWTFYFIEERWRGTGHRETGNMRSIPWSLDSALGPDAKQREVTYHLWLCGVDGRDIFRALSIDKIASRIVFGVMGLSILWFAGVVLAFSVMNLIGWDILSSFSVGIFILSILALASEEILQWIAQLGFEHYDLFDYQRTLYGNLRHAYSHGNDYRKVTDGIDNTLAMASRITSIMLIGFLVIIFWASSGVTMSDTIERLTETMILPIVLSLLTLAIVFKYRKVYTRRKQVWIKKVRLYIKRRELFSLSWDLMVRKDCVGDDDWYVGREDLLSRSWKELMRFRKNGRTWKSEMNW